MELGAPYTTVLPVIEMVPTGGLSAQMKRVSVAPETVTVNCSVCDAFKLALIGLSVRLAEEALEFCETEKNRRRTVQMRKDTSLRRVFVAA